MGELICCREICARKAHVCDTCNGKIEKGAHYVKVSYKADGRMYGIAQHVHCASLVTRYCEVMGVNEYCDSDVQDWARDEICRACGEYEDCSRNTLLCPIVIKSLLPQNYLNLEEVRRYTEGGNNHEQ